jgi:hypothetical protein
MADVMRQNTRVLTEEERNLIGQIKLTGDDFHDLLDSLPQSRETSLAKTRLEECVMWAVKSCTA